MATANLEPKWPVIDEFKKAEMSKKISMKDQYDRQHRVKPLPPVHVGDPVWIPDMKTDATVVDKANTPRSLIVKTPKGEIRRNRAAVSPLPVTNSEKQSPSSGDVAVSTSSSDVAVSTRSGRLIKPPKRLDL